MTLAVLLSAAPAQAAISSLGDVAPHPPTTTAASSLFVGNTSTGTVVVTAGSDVVALNSTLGQAPGAFGVVQVSGSGSSWTMGQGLIVGNGGDGIVQVAAGGEIHSASGVFGAQAESMGTVSIDGAGSKWVVSSDLIVGEAGSGTLTIADGGMVNVMGNLTLGNTVGGDGTIELADGTLRLHGNQLSVNAGTGTLEFSGGRIEGVGVVNLDGPLVQYGGTLAPGDSVGTTRVEDGYVLEAGRLEIEINDAGMPGILSDQLRINGTVDLLGDNGVAKGGLQVVLGFAPSIDDEFLIIENDLSDTINGTFAGGNVASATFGDHRYQFKIMYSAGDGNDVLLRTDAIQMLGDFNGDGKVDAADYTVWRDGLGTLYTLAEYDEWKSHFGNAVGDNSILNTQPRAVPEPKILSMLPSCLLIGALRVRSRRRFDLPWVLASFHTVASGR